MLKKFFFRRFKSYILLMMVPMLAGMCVFLVNMNAQADAQLSGAAAATLSNVSANLDYTVNNMLYQGNILANSSGMRVALKKLLAQKNNISYRDSVNLSNVQNMISSMIQTCPYVESAFYYMDGYDNIVGADGLTALEAYPDLGWKAQYEAMAQDCEAMAAARQIQETPYSSGKTVLTFYRRMIPSDGVIVLNIDLEAYKSSIKESFAGEHETLYLFNGNGDFLLSAGEEKNLDQEAIESLSGRGGG